MPEYLKSNIIITICNLSKENEGLISFPLIKILWINRIFNCFSLLNKIKRRFIRTECHCRQYSTNQTNAHFSSSCLMNLDKMHDLEDILHHFHISISVKTMRLGSERLKCKQWANRSWSHPMSRKSSRFCRFSKKSA